ncbi:MAG: hypothetical protein ACUVQ1_00020 [Candidatus Kapaibacteriales bacterium]
MYLNLFFWGLSIFFIFSFPARSQGGGKVVTGEDKPLITKDTTIRFTSPRPLIENEMNEDFHIKFWGLNFLLSNNGFGFGGYYESYLSPSFSVFASLYLSGARNTDEFEYYNPITGEIFIPGKINRLYILPLTIGFNNFVFTKLFNSNFSPYLSFGLGPTIIISTPYQKEFFTSFGYARFFVRFGSFVGLGVNFPTTTKSYFGVSTRYYWIPFGGNGLESIIDMPIKDFGGVFISLNFGIKL